MKYSSGWGKYRYDKKQLSVYFDAETFDEISAISKESGLSYAAVIRDLVEWGLEDHRKEHCK